jgi:hypothetical protein
MDKDELCKKIIEIDSRIRYVGLINEKGRQVAGGMKPGIMSLEESRDNEMIYLQLALQLKMRKSFDEAFGPVKFSLAYRDKLVIMSFPVNEHVLLVSSEKEVDFFKLPFEILEIIQSEN